MHVAMDGKRFFLNASGLGRYSRTLVPALLDEAPAGSLTLTMFKPPGEVKFEAIPHPRLQVAATQQILPGNVGNALWRFRTLPKLIDHSRFSLFHGPSHILPRKKKCPMVVTMMDLIFLRYPAYFPLWDRNYYRYMFKKSSRRADHIISISNATKADLVNYMGVREEKITVIYPAYDNTLTPLAGPQLEDVRRRYDLPDNYILYVGTIEPRKNILRTAQAFDRLIDSGRIGDDVQFLIVGGKGWFYDDILNGIEKLPHRTNIRLVGWVLGEDLPGIYQLATVMAAPSEFEGFGYPVLESMQLGTAVLTSRISSLPEVGGTAAHYVDPGEVDDIAAGLDKLLNNKAYREALVQKGLERAKQFSVQKMARQTLDIYKMIAR
ncbi:MAG: glycosyltransferase family 4 protein [Deltaproteobacteria bacterium]|nr:glycosyltransferase family 4 protein [Deltaproteobacteria bacterium]